MNIPASVKMMTNSLPRDILARKLSDQTVNKHSCVEGLQDDGTLKFVNPTFPPPNIKKIIRSRDRLESYDVTLLVGKHTIKSHRVVLSAFSEYFKRLLNNDMKEGNMSDIEIEELSGHYVELLVDFAYSSELLIDADNVQGIVETANYLGLDSVCTACWKFIRSNLDIENCAGVYQLAHMLDCLELRKEAFELCLRYFYDITQNGWFQFLDVQLFAEILKSESLLVVIDDFAPIPSVQEQLILEATLSFVKSNQLSISEVLPDLLSIVRLPLVQKEYLRTFRLNRMVSGSNRCQEIISKALNTSVGNGSKSLWCRARQHAGLKFKSSWAYGLRETYTHFNDRNVSSHVVGLKIFMRKLDEATGVTGLCIFYHNQQTTKYGETDCEEEANQDVHEFRIPDEERIVRVHIGHSLVISELAFYTNTGRQYGPFGGPGAKLSTITPPEQSAGYLAYLKGSIVNTNGCDEIVELRFVWAYYDSKNIRSDHDPAKKRVYITKSFVKLKS